MNYLAHSDDTFERLSESDSNNSEYAMGDLILDECDYENEHELELTRPDESRSGYDHHNYEKNSMTMSMMMNKKMSLEIPKMRQSLLKLFQTFPLNSHIIRRVTVARFPNNLWIHHYNPKLVWT